MSSDHSRYYCSSTHPTKINLPTRRPSQFPPVRRLKFDKFEIKNYPAFPTDQYDLFQFFLALYARKPEVKIDYQILNERGLIIGHFLKILYGFRVGPYVLSTFDALLCQMFHDDFGVPQLFFHLRVKVSRTGIPRVNYEYFKRDYRCSGIYLLSDVRLTTIVAGPLKYADRYCLTRQFRVNRERQLKKKPRS